MRIAIVSDIHDNLWNLAAALESLRSADALICCGDLCSPFVMDQLATFPGPVHIVFGNNDADLFRITRKSTERVQVHGEFFEAEFDGRKFAVEHFDNMARPIAESGRYDVVCYGHNHEFRIARVGRTLAVNPGPIMGARFPGRWVDVEPTFVVYDTQSGEAQALEIAPGDGGRKRVHPHAFVIQNGW